jgi:hypothetical protein
MDDDTLMDTYNFANTEQTQDNIISELLDEIADAFEDDQIPTKSTTSETDESADPDVSLFYFFNSVQ